MRHESQVPIRGQDTNPGEGAGDERHRHFAARGRVEAGRGAGACGTHSGGLLYSSSHNFDFWAGDFWAADFAAADFAAGLLPVEEGAVALARGAPALAARWFGADLEAALVAAPFVVVALVVADFLTAAGFFAAVFLTAARLLAGAFFAAAFFLADAFFTAIRYSSRQIWTAGL